GAAPGRRARQRRRRGARAAAGVRSVRDLEPGKPAPAARSSAVYAGRAREAGGVVKSGVVRSEGALAIDRASLLAEVDGSLPLAACEERLREGGLTLGLAVVDDPKMTIA